MSEIDRACSAKGEEERRMQGPGAKPEGRKPLAKPRHKWEYNIRINLQEVGVGLRIESSWLRIARSGLQF
jgi:hypothetical protein